MKMKKKNVLVVQVQIILCIYHGSVFVSNDIFGHSAIGRGSVALFTIRGIIVTCINVISRISWSMHFGACISAFALGILKTNLV